MRLWSLHPMYLDDIGLSRCYYEGVGGLKAMLGLQKMHKNHPQLIRFKERGNPVNDLSYYLTCVYCSALDRNKRYKYGNLITGWRVKETFSVPVTKGQIEFEVKWLSVKIQSGRCKNSLEKLELLQSDYANNNLKLHPLFYQVEGLIESWEKSHKGVIND